MTTSTAATTTTTTSSTKKHKFVSSDDKIFEIDDTIAIMSKTISNMLEGDFFKRVDDFLTFIIDIVASEDAIPLPNITGQIFEKVISYCSYHHEHPDVKRDEESDERQKIDEPICQWDQDFCKIELGQIFEIMCAANYLDIRPLIDLTCKTIANMIKGKTTEEMRKLFSEKYFPFFFAHEREISHVRFFFDRHQKRFHQRRRGTASQREQLVRKLRKKKK